MKKRVRSILIPIMLVFTFGQLSGQSTIGPVNDFLKNLKGNIHPSIGWYTGTQLDSEQSLAKGFQKAKDSEWLCKIAATKTPNQPDAIDVTASFKLTKGSASSAAVAVSFDFDQWSTENYILVPAIVYNGNRYRSIGNGYMPQYPKDMYYNPDVPLTISNNPRLSNKAGEPSLIELQTTNAATPAVCFYSPSSKKGFYPFNRTGYTFR